MSKPDTLSCWTDHGTGAGNNDHLILLRPELFVICALKSLVIRGEEVSILADIQRGNQEGLYVVVARAAAMLNAGQQTGTCSVHSQE